MSCIQCRKIQVFISSALSLLSPSSSKVSATPEDLVKIINIFQTRILPEVEATRDLDTAQVQASVVTLVLGLLRLAKEDQRDFLLTLVSHWYQKLPDWKTVIHTMLEDRVSLERHSSTYRLFNRRVLRSRMLSGQQYSDCFLLPLSCQKRFKNPSHLIYCHYYMM